MRSVAELHRLEAIEADVGRLLAESDRAREAGDPAFAIDLFTQAAAQLALLVNELKRDGLERTEKLN